MDKEKSRIRVLIVDDNPAIGLFMEQLFLSEGCDVVIAETGEEAVGHFRKQVFDAAFIDIRLSGMNGLETYKEMLKINPKTKAIMMTGYAADEIVAEALKSGVLYCLKKPFGIDELLEICNRFIK